MYPRRPGWVHVGHDVDEHDGAHGGRREFAREKHCGEPTQGGTHQHRLRRKVAQHFEHVTGEGGDAVVAVGGPVGLAVAAEVDRDRLPPTLGHRGSRSAPRPPGLAAAVQEHHGRRKWIAKTVGDDANAVDTVGGERVG